MSDTGEGDFCRLLDDYQPFSHRFTANHLSWLYRKPNAMRRVDYTPLSRDIALPRNNAFFTDRSTDFSAQCPILFPTNVQCNHKVPHSVANCGALCAQQDPVAQSQNVDAEVDGVECVDAVKPIEEAPEAVEETAEGAEDVDEVKTEEVSTAEPENVQSAAQEEPATEVPENVEEASKGEEVVPAVDEEAVSVVECTAVDSAAEEKVDAGNAQPENGPETMFEIPVEAEGQEKAKQSESGGSAEVEE